MTMTVAELIEKLTQVDPNLLVCGDDGERGLHADVELYELTAYVDWRGPFAHPFVDSAQPNNRIGQHDGNERVVVLTRWGHGGSDDEANVKEL